ncbi:hypothetical protein NHQ30_006703 [Ciborinia camelliae]|nr:hypothetical protein NHQ30_006703 [Ciborinia camelliae]
MASPDYNDKPEDARRYDLSDWIIICQFCLKPISATRPPVYNEVNCGCSELGTRGAVTASVTQPDTQELEPNFTVYKQPTYTYTQDSIPEYVSSHIQTSSLYEELSVHEANNNFQNLNINWNNEYHKNDTTATQNYSIQSYSWSLRAWLKENESSYTLSSTPRNSPSVDKSSSMKAKNGSKRGNSSVHSSGSGVEPGLTGWGPDPFTETGAWASEKYQEANQHPLAMSGISDCAGKCHY